MAFIVLGSLWYELMFVLMEAGKAGAREVIAIDC